MVTTDVAVVMSSVPGRAWPHPRVRDALRVLVVQRDGSRCHYCGRTLGRRGAGRLTLDHVWPVCFGRIDALWNLVPACGPCNSRRGHDTTWCACPGCTLALRLGAFFEGSATRAA